MENHPNSDSIWHEIQSDVLIVHQNGITDIDVMLKALAEGLADSDLPDFFHLLWDGRNSSAEIKPDGMKELMARFPQQELGKKRFSRRLAMLVDTTKQFGVSRMFSAYADVTTVKVNVFYELEDAIEWLRLEQS